VVVVSGVAVHDYFAGSRADEAYAMVLLVRMGYATQEEVARVFGCSTRTVRRHQRRYEQNGVAALSHCCGWPRGRRRLSVSRQQQIERCVAAGLGNREIARRLGVSEHAIRKQVGPRREKATQLSLSGLGDAPASVGEMRLSREESDGTSAESPGPHDAEDLSPAATESTALESPSVTEKTIVEGDPRDRSFDRVMACVGLLDDASPLFAQTDAVPFAGVLFALPALVRSGVFRLAVKHYGGIGPAFFGPRSMMLVLLFMVLWRIKSPEALKEHDPATLGLVLGLDRAPEVKTVRRKLARLAALHKAADFGRDLASQRVEMHGAVMGYLYVDGHVRAYHGKQDIPKAHVARMRISMPATTDYWIGDERGDPLFVLTADANASLSQVLPRVLDEIRDLVGDRAVTIVFDRGGWNLQLFKQVIERGFHILTYRKGKAPLIDEDEFVEASAVVDGRRVSYKLHDQEVSFLDGKLRLRQLTRLAQSGHQTQVVTSHFDTSAVELAVKMFDRWRQENFFKYARQELALDALADYQIEPDDPTRTVPNPERKNLSALIKSTRNEIKKLEQEVGAALAQAQNSNRPALEMLSCAKSTIDNDLAAANENLIELRARLKNTKKRVEIRDLSDDAVIKLFTERKLFTSIIKMLAFQAESDMLPLIGPHYCRCDDEGRTLLHELFRASADLRPSRETLTVTLRPLSSPHRTAVIERLCESLNDTNTCFPGSNLVMRFQVAPLPNPTLAFPGPRPKPFATPPDPPDNLVSP